MLELMHEVSGIGLAAPQIGLPWRLFVTYVPDADPVDRIFVNPVVHLDLCGLPPHRDRRAGASGPRDETTF